MKNYPELTPIYRFALAIIARCSENEEYGVRIQGAVFEV